MMDEPRFAQPIPNVTVAVGRDANLPCVVEHLGSYKVSMLNIIIHLHIAAYIAIPFRPKKEKTTKLELFNEPKMKIVS